MARRAILHIGTEKTGTTSIQTFLARRRGWLNRHGFHYPKAPGTPNHTRLFGYAVSNPRLAFGVRTAEEHAALRETLAADLAGECEANPEATFVFSNEHLHSRVYHPGEIARLCDLLARFFDRVDVLVYLRRQDQLAVSLYSTMLKAGAVPGELLVAKPIPELPAHAPEQTLYYDYEALIARWGAAFGTEHMIVRRFPTDLVAGSSIRDLSWVLGLPDPEREPEHANPSLAPDAQQFLRLVNPHLKGLPAATRGEIVAALPDLGGEGRLPARAAAAAFADRFAAGNEAVRAAWFPQAETLFDDDFSRYPEVEPDPAIGSDAVARIAAEALRSMAQALHQARHAETPPPGNERRPNRKRRRQQETAAE